MKRRDFLKLSAPMALSPLVLNGMPAKGMMNLFEFNKILSETNFDGRQVVIIQMRGGNDFLNTFVPLSQMSHYQAARTNIRIPQNSLITLDTNLPDNKQIGLHPSLQKIKNLYDESKVNIVNGIGYEVSNYSHFRSTDLIFGAKDGHFGGSIYDGWLAKYLSSVYPGFIGEPSNSYPHPLGIQIGDNAPHIGYRHQSLHNVGINITSLVNTGQIETLSEPDDSQYEDLLEYVRSVDFASDRYNSAIQQCFGTGTNSYSYDNTYLSNQLKVIAKLISGGIESKLFVTDMVGWDTHDNQLNRQANLLSQFANAVFSFQKDLEAQNKADDVVIITISEFGRKIIENGSGGTDHGDISSWMVIGKGVKKGVTGRNVNINPNLINDEGRSNDALQHDYRRYLSSVMQDWFGNTNNTLSQIKTGQGEGETLVNFAGNLKLNLFKNGVKIPENQLVDNFDKANIIIRELVPVTTINGWTYYGEDEDSTDFYFAIEHNPVNGNTSEIQPSITTYELVNDTQDRRYFSATQNLEGNFMLGNFWNMDLNDSLLDGHINIRFFIDPQRLTELNSVAQAFKTAQGSAYSSNMLWIRSSNQFMNIPEQINHIGLNIPILPLELPTTGTYNNQNYLQFNNIEFDGLITGGGGSIRVLEESVSDTQHPANPVPGMLIYNQETGTIQGYTGTEWVDLN